ncbi:MAG: PIG-L family deacetylase [Chloroflexi bacterium]|nr:MAG: PIG-L family deacetylase [Chloroflexota bacterium]RLC86618.1 MAG: PIG-L family deacetylase [Chloroflexota bacterium]
MKILVLSPHTDDAELGAGGSIARFLEQGDEILWVVFSSAEESLPTGMPSDTLRLEFQQAVADLGLANYRVFDFRVRYLFQERQTILEELVQLRNNYNPDLVLTPSTYDHHQDHQVVSDETVRAFKNCASIVGYELPWNHTQFTNPLLIRLDESHMEKKWQMLTRYHSQVIKGRPYFSKEFVYGLARVRGCQCNAEYAESFEVIRWIL